MKTKFGFFMSLTAITFLLLVSFTGKQNKGISSTDNPERLKRGERIVMAYCTLCHGGEDGKLSGKYMSDIPEFIGKVYTANITNHVENGIGNYTREQLRTLFRTRIKANGKKAIGIMPVFPLMADDDIEAIIDFLKSDHFAVQASPIKQKPSEAKWVLRMFDKKLVALPMPEKPIPMPDPGNKIELGGYYVNAVFRCYECHSGDLIPLDQNPTSSKKYLAGGNTMADEEKRKVKIPNITPDKETGIGNWSLEDFRNLMRKGIRKNGKPVRYPMFPIPSLYDEEIEAIYTYIMAQKPIKHKVKEVKVK